MHPILARGRLGIYLIAWIPIAGLLAVLLGLGGHRGWLETFALALPLALVDAFLCLGSWSLCRTLPLSRTGVGRIAAALGVAAVVSSGVWTALGRGWSVILKRLLRDPEVVVRFDRDLPILLGVGVLLFLLAAAVHYLLIAFEASRAAETRALELQVLARDARLESLQSQINPHFLFNSLNAISALTGSEPSSARRMCLLLAAFLRRSLSLGARREIRLDEEISLVDDFLAIEQVRFGPRLRIDRRIAEDTTGLTLPPLALQPLIENAVNHGIATLIEGGTVRVESRTVGGRLILTVENPYDPDAKRTGGAGLGIANLRARLAGTYGSEARLAVERNRGSFCVTLTLPSTGWMGHAGDAGSDIDPSLGDSALREDGPGAPEGETSGFGANGRSWTGPRKDDSHGA